MRESQVTNSKFPALKHLICSTFQPLGLLQEIYILKKLHWLDFGKKISLKI